MSSRHRPQTDQCEGFTLIELLIVIVILGILAAVVIFTVDGVSGTAIDNACAYDARTVRTAVGAYIGETAAPTVTYADLVSSGWLESASTNYALAANGTISGVGQCV